MMGLLLAIGGPPVLGPATASAAASDLFFSEYIEGSAENKALEIYNGTGTPVNLASYRIDLYNNGNNAPNATYTLSGMLGTGMTLVIVHQNASAALKNAPSAYVESTKVTSFDGDDALVLVGPNGPVDRIGRVGEDLGDEWAGNGVSTRSSTLRRKPNV